jgi:hypothetical protein
MPDTANQYSEVIDTCQKLFFRKHKDYGTAWRIMRPQSVTDQIFIKAQRIRSLELNGVSKVGEGIVPEYIGIVNYGIIALIQLLEADCLPMEISEEQLKGLYSKYAGLAQKLMMDKNHDYGEAWRDMRTSSITDLILMKIHRTKQIEDNGGQASVSEGIDANYYDMINYSVFALIKLSLENEPA